MARVGRSTLGLLLCAAALVAGCGGGGEEGDTGGTAGGKAAVAPVEHLKVDRSVAGRVAGMVRFSGQPPPPRRITFTTGDCAALHSQVTVNDVDVHDGKLAGAFVYVKAGLERYSFDPPPEPVLLDQVGCMFEPHVVAISVGQKLRMRNSDAALHNVHTFPQLNDLYNRAFPYKDAMQETSFTEAEVMIPIKCDVHGWMTAFVGVTAHPFRCVTGPDGAFAFDGLPPGNYLIEAWHEKLKPVSRRISLKPKESLQTELVLQ